jgi:NAD/NADP transhydrogenase alpha subunit
MAVHASLSWSRNVEKLLNHLMGKEAVALKLDAADEITQSMVTVRAGAIVDKRLTQGANP